MANSANSIMRILTFDIWRATYVSLHPEKTRHTIYGLMGNNNARRMSRMRLVSEFFYHFLQIFGDS